MTNRRVTTRFALLLAVVIPACKTVPGSSLQDDAGLSASGASGNNPNVGGDVTLPESSAMDIGGLRQIAYARCQVPQFARPSPSPVPALDPPIFNKKGIEKHFDAAGNEAPQDGFGNYPASSHKGPGIDYSEEGLIQSFSGDVNVTVNAGTKGADCANQIIAAVPGLVVKSSSDDPSGATPSSASVGPAVYVPNVNFTALVNQVKGVACVASASPGGHDLFSGMQFFFNSRPRAALNQLPVQLFLKQPGDSVYNRIQFDDAKFNYTNPGIDPPIDATALPPWGKVLTKLVVGHQAPNGWPGLFDFGSTAYLRFQGYQQVPGASFRVSGAHGVFGNEWTNPTNGQVQAPEDFGLLEAAFVTPTSNQVTNVLALIESDLFCGALSIDMVPGDTSVVNVDGYWYTRRDFDPAKEPNTGFAAYSSMFYQGTHPAPDGHHDEHTDAAHDSDTLIVNFTDGTNNTIKIAPPASGLTIDEVSQGKPVQSFLFENQDRNPVDYTYYRLALKNSSYENRASYGVQIIDTNVATGVRLVQHVPNKEYLDNLVAFSSILQPIPKSTSVDNFTHFQFHTWSFYPN